MKAISAILLLGVGVLGTTGCGSACSLIGCPAPVQVVLEGTSTWQVGTYVLSVETPTIERSCEIELGASSGLGGQGGQVGDACRQTHPFQARVHEGNLLITFTSPQDEVDLRIDFGGQEVFSRTIRPEYQTSTPNGPGCGECESAEIVVDVSR